MHRFGFHDGYIDSVSIGRIKSLFVDAVNRSLMTATNQLADKTIKVEAL